MEKSTKRNIVVAGFGLALAGVLTGGYAGGHPGAAASPGAVRAQRVDNASPGPAHDDIDIPEPSLSPTAVPSEPTNHVKAVTIKVKNQSHFKVTTCLQGAIEGSVCTDVLKQGAPSLVTGAFNVGQTTADFVGFAPGQGPRDKTAQLQLTPTNETVCVRYEDTPDGRDFALKPQITCDGF